MSYKVISLFADGAVSVRFSDKKPRYDEIQKLLGEKPAQLIPEFKKFDNRACEAYADEEGKYHGLRLNVRATRIWHEQMAETGRSFRPDTLVGTVIVVQKERAETFLNKKEEADDSR